MITLQEAHDLARACHKGQVRRNGYDYIKHAEDVMNMVNTDLEKITAILHDSIEDSDAMLVKSTLKDNSYIFFEDQEYIINDSIFKALVCLTKTFSTNYDEYINFLKHDKLALKVKLADIYCNSIDSPSTKQLQKYKKALKVLLKEI